METRTKNLTALAESSRFPVSFSYEFEEFTLKTQQLEMIEDHFFQGVVMRMRGDIISHLTGRVVKQVEAKTILNYQELKALGDEMLFKVVGMKRVELRKILESFLENHIHEIESLLTAERMQYTLPPSATETTQRSRL